MPDPGPTPDPSPEELEAFTQSRLQHEGAYTDTWSEQHQVEERIFLIRQANGPDKPLVLLREKHVTWLTRCLHQLPKGFEAFDALQGWLAFWIVHSLDLLGATIPEEDSVLLVEHLKTFRDPTGGYGGGPQQCAHMASTFSVFMTLCVLGSDRALESVDRAGIGRFVRRMKRDDGGFRVSEGGETDVRAMYCALAVSSMLGLLDGPEGMRLRARCGEYLESLQAFDGGLGGEPGAEAHGGNTYCGVAAGVILGGVGVDAERVLDWAVMRQMGYEGGFQGRANKLVDSCYSFWVGGVFPLLAMLCGRREVAGLFDAEALQRYVLECCQLANGGMRDKPGVARDLMHTCYALSGLSVAQHFGGLARRDVRGTNPVYNLGVDRFERAWAYFRR